MTKLIRIACAIAAFVALAHPASARCADDLKAAKASASHFPDSKKNERQTVLRKLEEAEAALGKRDEHGCKAAVAAASTMMK